MDEAEYPRLRVMLEAQHDTMETPLKIDISTRTGNLVICAHNYDRHFGPIRYLQPGDEVYFTDMLSKYVEKSS